MKQLDHRCRRNLHRLSGARGIGPAAALQGLDDARRSDRGLLRRGRQGRRRITARPSQQFLADVEQIVHGTTLGTNILITERGAKVGMITTKGFRDIAGDAPRHPQSARLDVRHVHRALHAAGAARSAPRRGRAHAATTARSTRRWTRAELRAAAQKLIDDGCTRHRHLLPALLRQRRERAEGQAHRPGDGARRLRDDVARDPAGVARVRALLHRGGQRLYRSGGDPLCAQAAERPEGVRLPRPPADDARQRPGAGRRRVRRPRRLSAQLRPGGGARRPRPIWAALHGKNNLLSMDMGGTSFDVCVIKDGDIPTTTESWVGEHRVAIKMVDVPTVGAGGGSLALDRLARPAAGRAAERGRRSRDRPPTARARRPP